MARNPGTPKNASFDSPAVRPVDIQYRVKRLQDAIQDALMYINAVDPEHLANHEAIVDALVTARRQAEDAERLRPSTGPERKAGREQATLESLQAEAAILFEGEVG